MTEPIERLTLTEEDLRRDSGRVRHLYGVPATYKIHSHDFYELFLVPRGRAVHWINNQTQLLTEGSLVLIRPDDVHKYEFFNQSHFEILNIGIPKTIFHRLCAYLDIDHSLLDAPQVSPHRILSGSVLTDAVRKLKRNEFPESPEEGYRYVLSVLPSLVYLFLVDTATEPELPHWLSALLLQMDKQENYIAGLPCMLALAGVSQEHLTRSFRRHLGVTPTAFINAKRLSMAAELLLAGKVPAIDVGGLCGFNSQSHFYRLFTERYGCPPGAFRETFLLNADSSTIL